MSRGTDDVARSIRRYFAGMLPFPWSFDLERVEVADSQRPAALIEIGEAETRNVKPTIPSPAYEMVMPVTVVLYPSLPPGKGGPREAGRTARRLADALGVLVDVGADGIVDEDGRPMCGPLRIPLWDFDDVALFGDVEDRTAPEFPIGVMWVESSSANAIQDPQDARRWTVVLDLRVSWEHGGRSGPVGPVVTSVGGQAVFPPRDSGGAPTTSIVGTPHFPSD